MSEETAKVAEATEIAVKHEVKSEDSQPQAESQFVRLRGLPFNASEKDIQEFFTGLAIKRVKFLSVLGRPNGEALVEFKSNEDASHAMQNDRKEMSSRYIEVFTLSAQDAENSWNADAAENHGQDDHHVVRLRGVPWACKEDDVRQFFEGLDPLPAEIVIGGTGGPRSRPSGEAFVRFASAEAAQKALEYNKKHMGSRYVEVFLSSMTELNREKGIPPPPGSAPPERTGIRPLMSIERSDNTYGPQAPQGHQAQQRDTGYGGSYGGYEDQYQQRGYGAAKQADYGYGYDQGAYDYSNETPDPYRIYMRGLPYDADAHAIEAFFSPLPCHSVKLGINDQGRPSGDAIAEFEEYNDMVSAMARNNQRMGRRYVELFYTRDVPGPMRRLLWKETSGPNVGAAPAADPVLAGRRAGPPRDYRAPREQWGQQQRPRHEGGAAPRSRGPRAEPWGGYGQSAAAAYEQAGYGSWEAYGYGQAAPPPPATGYDREREPRDSAAAWGAAQQQQGAYGGWGAGDQRGGY